jgi:GT2 family glycosyltransferase
MTTSHTDVSKTEPLVSVVMPFFNAGDFIEQALGSIIRQTYHNLEILLIDDGSTDNSAEIVRSFQDPRVKLLGDRYRRGITYRLNEGIDAALGDYVARMDADDVSSPARIECQVSKMKEDRDLVVLGTAAAYFDATGKITGAPRESPTGDTEIKWRLLTHNCILHPSVMLRSDVVKSERYSSDFPLAQDFELWLRLAARGYKFANLPQTLVLIRRHDATATSTRRREQLNLAAAALKSYVRSELGIDVSRELAEALIEPPLLKNSGVADKSCPISIARMAAIKFHHAGAGGSLKVRSSRQMFDDLTFFAMRYMYRGLFRRVGGSRVQDVAGLRAALGEIFQRFPVIPSLVYRDFLSRRRRITEASVILRAQSGPHSQFS